MSDSDDGLRKKAIRSVGWVVAEKWSVRLLSLVVFATLTRFVPVADFGLISLATVFTAILAVFVDSGFAKSLVQRAEIGPKDASTAFWTSLLIAVVLCVATILCAPLLASAYSEPRLAPVLSLLALALPIMALSGVPAALLEREMSFGALASRTLIGTCAGAAVALPMAILGAGVWAMVAQTLTTAVASTVALWASTSWRPRFQYSWVSLKSLAAFGVSVLGIELLTVLQANIDKLLIGSLMGATMLGYYFVAQRALNIVSDLVTSVMGKVSLTTFSKAQTDKPRLSRMFLKFTFFSSFIAIPVFGLAALVSPQLVPGVFGHEWTSVVPVFIALAPSAALVSITGFDKSVLLAAGRNRTALLIAIGQFVLGVVLLLVAVPFGLVAVALSRTARALLFWPIRITVLRRSIGLRGWPYLAQVGAALIGLIPAAALIVPLQYTEWAHVDGALFLFAIPVALMGFALYLPTVWLVSSKANREMMRTVARDVVPSRLRRRRKGRSDGNS